MDSPTAIGQEGPSPTHAIMGYLPLHLVGSGQVGQSQVGQHGPRGPTTWEGGTTHWGQEGKVGSQAAIHPGVAVLGPTPPQGVAQATGSPGQERPWYARVCFTLNSRRRGGGSSGPTRNSSCRGGRAGGGGAGEAVPPLPYAALPTVQPGAVICHRLAFLCPLLVQSLRF